MVSSPETDSLNSEKILSEAYLEFAHAVVKVCTEKATGTPAFFSLHYVRIEFTHLLQLNSPDKRETSLLMESYLNKGIQIIDSALKWLENDHEQLQPTVRKNQPELRWTGKTIDLIEMAMAVHESGSINNGEVTVKAVVLLFCEIFGVNPGNFSSVYGVMRTRANSRTLFLDKLKKVFEKKMDRDAEKGPKRK